MRGEADYFRGMTLPLQIDELSGVIDRLQASHPERDYGVLRRAVSGETVPATALAALVRGSGRRQLKPGQQPVENLLRERMNESTQSR